MVDERVRPVYMSSRPTADDCCNLWPLLDVSSNLSNNANSPSACLMHMSHPYTFLQSAMSTVEGTLKGWDQLLNLVLDDVEELVRGQYEPLSNLISNVLRLVFWAQIRRRCCR